MPSSRRKRRTLIVLNSTLIVFVEYSFSHVPLPYNKFHVSLKGCSHNCGKSTLFLQRLQKLMEVIYRILNGLYPSYLNDIITVEELQHLRCRSRLFIPPFSTVRCGKKSLSYLSPVLWNSLGNDIKQCDVLTAFKKRIKLWKGPTCNCGLCAQCRMSNR